ncbi:MAG: lysylphosphatidylglycerol synthase transmembrane domain-containing protein [Bacteroidales bacterium]
MKISKIQSNIIKAVLAIVALAYLVYRLVTFEHWDQAGQRFSGAFQGKRLFFLAAAVLLIFLNFSAEAIKWQRLVNRLEPVSYLKAMAGVLASLTMAITTPNRIGDVITRGLILKPGHRLAGTGHTFLCILAQMVVTITVGLMGAALYLPANDYLLMDKRDSWMVTLAVSVAAGLILLILFFSIDRLSGFFQRFRWLKVFHPFLVALQGVSIKDKSFLLLFSTLKFLTYITQFYLILNFFGINIPPFTGLSAVSLIYLILHFVPVPTVGDLGVRGSVAILILGPYTSDVPAIVFTTFVIWIINIMIPAMIGLVLLRKIRLETVEIRVDSCSKS